jgi:murein DD-endopeptidase MepM/ murein hydrolase activator NlpD
MVRSKYKFNQESLNYDRVEKDFKQKTLKFLSYFVASVVLAFFYSIIFGFIWESPKVQGLKRENTELIINYDQLNEQISNVELMLDELRKRDEDLYRTIFGASPIHSNVRDAGYGGTNNYGELENLENSELVISVKKKLDILEKQMAVQSTSYDELFELAANKEKMIACIPAIQPISNKDLTRTASGWGWRIHPIYKIKKFHYGIDFTAPKGTEIYATGDGVIYDTDHSQRGYGNKVIIDHGFGYKSLYAHMSKIIVKEGQRVKRGDVIGYVGNTGLSTAPHLHYEVHLKNDKVNPINYFFNDLSAEEYDKMIEISQRSGQSFD